MASSPFLKVMHSSFALLFVMSLTMPVARAQAAAALTGVYNGKYTCAQGPTNLKLSVVVSPIGDVSALFTFYLPAAAPTQGYTYSLHGDYNPRTAKFSLAPVRWETEHPANFGMVGMNGTFEGDELSGNITGGRCGAFNVSRDKAETANIAAVIAAQKNGGKPVTPSSSTPQPAVGQSSTQPKTQASARPGAPAPAPAATSDPTAAPKAAPPQDAYLAAMRAQAPAGVKLPGSTTPAAAPQGKPSSPQPAQAAPAPAASPRKQDSNTQIAQQRAAPVAAATPSPSGAKAPASSSAQAGSQAKGQLSAKQQADLKKSFDAVNKSYDDMTDPVLKWELSQVKDPRVGGSSLHPVAQTSWNDENTVDAAVSCNQNGMSVFFTTDSYDFTNGPPAFVWYQDEVEKQWASEVRVTADGRSHTAKGFPDTDQDKLYSNSLGIFFYKPDLAKQEAREEDFEVRSAFGYGAGGIDGLLRPMMSGVEADLNDAAATSGGPVTDLLNAKSIRVDFSIQKWNDKPYLEINPQDPVLHKFVADCASKLGVGSSSAKPAPPRGKPAVNQRMTK